jgi:hypothetical protein
MTTVVLLVLAVVWAGLLASWLRSRIGGTFSDSVAVFRRHLSVLERAVPATVRPANRLRSGPVAGRQPNLYLRPPRYRPAVRPGSSRGGPASRAGFDSVRGDAVGLRPPSPAALRRRQAQRRRRDVLFALLAGVVGSLSVALIPGMKVMWTMQAGFDAVFVAYIVLLVHMRNLAVARARKLTFMPPQSSAGQRTPEERSYDFGELSLRRVAT